MKKRCVVRSSFDSLLASINERQPHWFPDHKAQEIAASKMALLDMARTGKKRPKNETFLCKRLKRFISRDSRCYDNNFSIKIKRLAPEWFLYKTKKDIARSKKILIGMAKRGDKRPGQYTMIGRRFYSFYLSYRSGYDKSFALEIRRIAPQWFMDHKAKKTSNCKKELLKMAKRGDKRPLSRTKLGSQFSGYVQKTGGHYDELFSRKVRRLAPQWFRDHRAKEIVACKKALLVMAKGGQVRPKSKTVYANRLSAYICVANDEYDKTFTLAIRRIAPNWFRDHKPQEIAARKKTFLEMAKRGEGRPKSKTLYSNALSAYICVAHRQYDEAFTLEIRRIAPHWFRRRRGKVSYRKSRVPALSPTS